MSGYSQALEVLYEPVSLFGLPFSLMKTKNQRLKYDYYNKNGNQNGD